MSHEIKCPICHANIETDVVPEKCPACKEYILDKLDVNQAYGLTTATAKGPNMKPLGGVVKDTYG